MVATETACSRSGEGARRSSLVIATAEIGRCPDTVHFDGLIWAGPRRHGDADGGQRHARGVAELEVVPTGIVRLRPGRISMTLGEKLLKEARSVSSGRCSVTIHGGHVKSLRQTAIGVVAGHRLQVHENTGEITLHLLSGRARVVAASDEVVLAAGDYAVIPLEWDSFEALDDSVVLLTAAVQGRQD